MEGDPNMDESVPVQQRLSDHPLIDTTQYGSGPDDSISDVSENTAVTQHSITINRCTMAVSKEMTQESPDPWIRVLGQITLP